MRIASVLFAAVVWLGTGWSAAQAAQQAQASPKEMRAVTLTGCVQATGQPDEFLLVVPAKFSDDVRGIAKGQPVPEDAGAGPEPRSNPLANPPVKPEEEARQPEGRYSTPAVRNQTFRLAGLAASDLKPLVGQAIEVVGKLPVRGFPSGDVPEGGLTAREAPPVPTLEATSFRQVADSCTALIQRR